MFFKEQNWQTNGLCGLWKKQPLSIVQFCSFIRILSHSCSKTIHILCEVNKWTNKQILPGQHAKEGESKYKTQQ
jgi:hypothetical protein